MDVEVREQSQVLVIATHFCLEQGLLFAAAYTKLAGPRASRDSLVSTPFAHMNDGITDMWAHLI